MTTDIIITDEMRMNWLENRWFKSKFKLHENTRILKYGTMGGEAIVEGKTIRESIDKCIREEIANDNN
jgi:uncharacterized protein YneR